jgi:hypothetical protein
MIENQFKTRLMTQRIIQKHGSATSQAKDMTNAVLDEMASDEFGNADFR